MGFIRGASMLALLISLIGFSTVSAEAKIRFSSNAPGSLAAGACGKYEVVYQNSSGVDANVPSSIDNRVRLRGLGTAVAYSNSTCTTAITNTSSGYPVISIAVGAQRGQYYVKAASAQTLTLVAEMEWGTSLKSATKSVSITGGGGTGSTGSAPSGPYRASWISPLGASIISAATGSSTRTNFFSELAQKNMNVAVIEATAALKSNRPRLKDFVEDARGHGVFVEVLMNFGSFRGTIQQNGTAGAEYGGYAKTYQQTYCPTGIESACLLAFHIDFEPHGFPEWLTKWSDENSTAGYPRAKFLTALTAIYNSLGGLALNADLPHWFENANNTNSSGVSLLKKSWDAGVKTVYIMNYTDVQSTAKSQLASEISIACSYPSSNPKYVVSLADVQYESSATLTFYGQGWTPVNALWDYLNNQHGGNSCWRGNGVFEYNGMAAM